MASCAQESRSHEAYDSGVDVGAHRSTAWGSGMPNVSHITHGKATGKGKSLTLTTGRGRPCAQASDLLLLSDATMVPLPVVPTHSVVLIASCS